MRVVVPFTPAGGPDFIARFVAERLSPRLGQPVVVENLPGASGNIGSLQVARAKPDGLTIMSSVNTLVMNASLFRNLPYDPVADFAPLGLSAWGTLVLVAHPSQKPGTLAEMIALAMDRSQSQTYASPGVGTPHHLAMALLETASGIELVHVPYKGSAGAVQDLLSGQVGYMFLPVHVAASYIHAGKLKAIAIGSPGEEPSAASRTCRRSAKAASKAPTSTCGTAFSRPRARPADVVQQLNREIVAIPGVSPEARTAFEKQGLTPATSTPAALGEIAARDRVRWADIVDEARHPARVDP